MPNTGYILFIPGPTMVHFSTLSGVFHTVIRCQAPKKEDGYRGEKMNKENSEEQNEEWIEVSIECPDCVKGRRECWRERKSGKPPWRYHPQCETCKGDYLKVIHQPKYCQIPSCVQHAEHKCGGVFCSGNGYVCSEHWREEDIGFSKNGYACINCWHEVGSGGH